MDAHRGERHGSVIRDNLERILEEYRYVPSWRSPAD